LLLFFWRKVEKYLAKKITMLSNKIWQQQKTYAEQLKEWAKNPEKVINKRKFCRV